MIREAAFAGLRWPLVVTGKPGTGKTCAGLCVADHVRGSNWWTWDDFWRFIADVNFGRATETRGGEWNQEGGYREVSTSVTWTPKKFWTSFGNLSLAVIDDVGLRASANDTQYEAMKTALDRREKIPLIVTSNLDLPELGKIFDLRIMDRLASGTVVELTGESRR